MGTNRRGQALLELACGMFALALVVSALCTFAVFIVNGLKAQNNLARPEDEKMFTVEVGPFAAEHLFGTEKFRKSESVKMPPPTLLR